MDTPKTYPSHVLRSPEIRAFGHVIQAAGGNITFDPKILEQGIQHQKFRVAHQNPIDPLTNGPDQES